MTGTIAIALAGCSSGSVAKSSEQETAQRYAGVEHGGETYPEFDARRDSYGGSRGTFADEGCTVDCGGHQAGYDWAEEKGITDPDNCGGNSWSFIEGCRAYAEEQSPDDEDEGEGEEE